MSKERWARVSEIFSDAVTLAGEARQALLDQRCAHDSELRHEVEAMLESDSRAGAFLAAPLSLVVDRTGTTLGAWVLERELGHGGMGAVWAASRADGAYRQQAAIKLIRGGVTDSWLARRFVAERQILASLTHPFIARLLDGGTTADGTPWLAMEFVDGVRIDAYCAEHRLTQRARLELLLQVASAVSYAHQHLVVHRDIKPANVLVTREGTPRLLDFGIARLVDAERTSAGEQTMGTLQALTPAWASPEQIRGEAVTTAGDVYSLGVLAYQLITGKLPCGEGLTAPDQLLRAVLEEEPRRPSLVAPNEGIERDLDAVLLKALEKDVARRYASVELFAKDLERFLGGRPVEAHAASWWYRASKLVSRNRALSVASSLVVLSLVAGIITSSWQAHVASRERARAEKHFRELRALSKSLIFEVHDAIEYLPGATEARANVVKKAVEFLDLLAADASGDAELARELALGYVKIADAQSSLYFANLGDAQGAAKSFAKADALLEPLGRAAHASGDDQAALATLRHTEAGYFLEQGQLDHALAAAREAHALRAAILASDPTNADARRAMATAINRLGDVLGETNDRAAALASYQQVLTVFEALVAEDPKSARNRWGVICAHTNAADELAKQHRYAEVKSALEQALALNTQLEVDKPDNYSVQQAYGIILQGLGEAALHTDELALARARLEEALKRRQALAAKDAKDMAAAIFVAQTRRSLGEVLAQAGEPARALEHLDGAQAVLDGVEKVEPGLRVTLAQVSLLVSKASAEQRWQHPAPACEALERARARLKPHLGASQPLLSVKGAAADVERAAASCPPAAQ
jgi:non-specific serine/threonine protein kinase/serine/threonine-protein kinase